MPAAGHDVMAQRACWPTWRLPRCTGCA